MKRKRNKNPSSFFKNDQDLQWKVLKDTHREKAPSNKTPEPTKSTNMGIWVVGTSIWVFGLLVQEILKLKQNFQKNEVVTDKTPFHVIGSFCTHHSTCLNIDFFV